MSMEYIRKTYSVPAKRGDRVRVRIANQPHLGVISSSRCGRLRIRLNGEKRSRIFHPLDVQWVKEAKPQQNDNPKSG